MTTDSELPQGAFGLRVGQDKFSPAGEFTGIIPQAPGVYLAHPDAKQPERHFEGDLGFDLFACADTFVPYQEPVIIPTGVIFAFPPGVGAIVTDRSSSFLKRRLMIHHGKIDQTYREEVGIIAWSLSGEEFDHGTEDEHGNRYGFRRGQWVRKGDRVAQVVFVPVHPWYPPLLSERPASIRGGYGSTGAR